MLLCAVVYEFRIFEKKFFSGDMARGTNHVKAVKFIRCYGNKRIKVEVIGWTDE